MNHKLTQINKWLIITNNSEEIQQTPINEILINYAQLIIRLY